VAKILRQRDRRESLQKATGATRLLVFVSAFPSSVLRPPPSGFPQTSAIPAAMMNAELTLPDFRRTLAAWLGKQQRNRPPGRRDAGLGKRIQM
jgi:hypothetical protein